MHRLSALWQRAWFEPTDARPIGLLRIGVGIIMALQLLERFPCARPGYSNQGYLPTWLARQMVSPFQWSVLWLLDDPWFVRLVMVVGALGAACFAVGYRTRLAGLVAFCATVSLHNRNAITMYGGDMLPRYFMFYLLLMPSDTALSIASLRRRSRLTREGVAGGRDPRAAPYRPPQLPEVWPVRLFQIQIFILYLFTGINKSYGTDYQEGVTLWYALVNPTFSRFYPWLVPLYRAMAPVLAAASVATLWWELALPFMLLYRPLRVIGLSMGLVVHGGIALLMRIGWWGPLMILSYLCFITDRPFHRARVLHIRERRDSLPRAQRLSLGYDPAEPRACELAARVALVDVARLVSLHARPGALSARVGDDEVTQDRLADALRALLPRAGRWVSAPLRAS